MPSPFGDLESKWQARWREARAYEPEVEEGREKFFATYPYSYMNAFAHVGHAYTMLRNDLLVRYQRMLGKNALYPFAFHVTGTPIVAAANRIRDGEPKQVKIMRDLGIPEGDIPRFADPQEWIRYFPKHWRADVERLGLAVDWRREFITTDLNPHYDAFIRWQFRKLHERGYVQKGSHPIVWCPKDRAPVADHDRTEGEGETPQEWTVVKARLVTEPPGGLAEEAGFVHLACATLRPDTMFGQTNVWIDPAAEYRVVRVGDERWVVNEGAATKLHHQIGAEDTGVTVVGTELVGARVHVAARDADVPVLPARFIKHDRGTGIVTSVPSDSPMDYVAIEDLKAGRFGDEEAQALARTIEVIPIIRTPEHGDVAARKLVERLAIGDQSDAAKIQEATEEAYKAGFYQGELLESCGPFAGRKVAEAKDEMRAWLVDQGAADVMYETTGPVRCRCLTPAIVKLVSDQWFMRYSDPEWKAATHAAIDRMGIHPEIARKQFHYVVDWLRDWACARETGLGTRLPWDERWLIESLSDSTIYMAYYTLARHLERGSVTGGGSGGERAGVDPGDLTDAQFDYVLLGAGDAASAAKGTVTAELLETMRREFSYWYPVDFRNSGKDLLQNHLTFFVFNHVAMWPQDPARWPRGIGVNGWVMVDGEKMSKSQGNFVILRDALDDFGTTVTRLVLANAGEGMDDANFDREFAHVAERRARQLLDIVENPPAARTEHARVDAWFRSALNRAIAECRAHMEAAAFKSALKAALFDLAREWQWYLRRASGVPHRDVLREYVDVQHRLLAPFVPELAEEIHERLGLSGKGFVIDAPYPAVDESAIDPAAEAAERYVRDVLEDVREILKVTRTKKPRRVTFYVAPEWKNRLYRVAVDEVAAGRKLEMKALMAAAKEDPAVQPHMKEAPKLAQDLVRSLGTLPREEAAARAVALDEADALRESAPFLGAELGGPEVAVFEAGVAGVPDPAGKARHATPRRPAIYME